MGNRSQPSQNGCLVATDQCSRRGQKVTKKEAVQMGLLTPDQHRCRSRVNLLRAWRPLSKNDVAALARF
jgi:hypothetical protein